MSRHKYQVWLINISLLYEKCLETQLKSICGSQTSHFQFLKLKTVWRVVILLDIFRNDLGTQMGGSYVFEIDRIPFPSKTWHGLDTIHDFFQFQISCVLYFYMCTFLGPSLTPCSFTFYLWPHCTRTNNFYLIYPEKKNIF